MIIGEAPGREEHLQGKPFVGAAGRLQQSLLLCSGLLQSSFRCLNLYPLYREGNPDPTPDEIEQFTPSLLLEIKETNPVLIIAVGRFSTNWFLGQGTSLEEVHGVPHRIHRCTGCGEILEKSNNNRGYRLLDLDRGSNEPWIREHKTETIKSEQQSTQIPIRDDEWSFIKGDASSSYLQKQTLCQPVSPYPNDNIRSQEDGHQRVLQKRSSNDRGEQLLWHKTRESGEAKLPEVQTDKLAKLESKKPSIEHVHTWKETTIVPVTHPAASFYDDTGHKLSMIDYDYRRAGETIRRIKAGEEIDYPIDYHAGCEEYEDVTGEELDYLIYSANKDDLSIIGIDTEETEYGGWIQVSWMDGTGYVLRQGQRDFDKGVQALQELVNSGVEVVLHSADTPQGCLYDIIKCREMGLELRRAKLFDTMYNLMLYRGEPRGLKPASFRFCGIRLTPYQSMIGDVGKEKQIRYLRKVLEFSDQWTKPERQLITENDGTSHFYTPQHISKTVARIISDVESGKINKDGPVDPYDRWYGIDKEVRKPVERMIGRLPIGTLDDIPLKDAIRYGGADADAPRRLSFKCKKRNAHEGLTATMDAAMRTIPHFEEMQYNGMPASRERLESLRDRMLGIMDEKQTRLSIEYFGGEPFNPASNPQTAELLNIRGLKAGKLTKKTGRPSTGKKSIEHLRYKDPAIELLFDWREHAKIKGFCTIFIEEFQESEDTTDIHSTINISKVETRRPSMEEPNLLNIPVRTEIGREVRACFMVAPGRAMLGGDLSQIEPRCLAHESGSRVLMDAFINDRDIYKEVAVRAFGVKPNEIDDFKHRHPSKTTVLGISYGQQGYGLYEQFRMYGLNDWTMSECESFRLEVLKILGIDEYIKRKTQDARRTCCVKDISGMPHYLPNLLSRDDRLRSEAERQVISYTIQSMAQFMIQNSMAHLGPIIWRMQDEGIDVKPRLQVYDELIYTCQEDKAEEVGRIMVDSLVNHCGIKLRVPIRAKAHIGLDWSMLK